MTDQRAQPFDEELAGEDEGQDPPPRRMTRRLAVIGGLASMLAAGAGYGAAAWFGLLGGHFRREPPPAFFDLPEMTVNLTSVDNSPQYLRIRPTLELKDASVATHIEPVLPRVLDAFQVYLRELRVSDLEGSAGLYRLKEELVKRVNMAIHPAEIEGVVFKELIVQ